MSKATAFTLGFVTGAAALGVTAYLAKEWTSEEDDEDEEEVSPHISETTSGENGKDASAKSPDVESAQESETPDTPKPEDSSATDAGASSDITDEGINATA